MTRAQHPCICNFSNLAIVIFAIGAASLVPLANAGVGTRRAYQRAAGADLESAQPRAWVPPQYLRDLPLHAKVNCSVLGPTTEGGLARCVTNEEDSVAASPVRPIRVPSAKSCSIQIMKDAIFGPYDHKCSCFSPPVIQQHDMPEECGTSWSKIILKWKVFGQDPPNYDRIGNVFVEGVEVFRTSTQEPFRRPPQRMYWEVEKDVTRFASLFKKKRVTTQASIGNLVVDRYVGIYNATASLEFYSTGAGGATDSKAADVVLRVTSGDVATGVSGIMNDEHNSLDRTYTLPRNIVRASLEVNAHPGGLCEEFYYFDLPNEYFNHTTPKGLPGPNFCLNPAGAFREVVALVDGNVAGVAWPFPSIFTGGVEPFLWRPIVATRAFDLPTYTFDITPFVGTLVDGRAHNFSFRVLGTDNRFASGAWFMTASIHLWLDPNCSQTAGSLTTADPFPEPDRSVVVDMDCNEEQESCLDGVSTIVAKRTFSTTGYVTSSAGSVETSVTTDLWFSSRNANKDNFNETVITNNVLFSNTVQRAPIELGEARDGAVCAADVKLLRGELSLSRRPSRVAAGEARSETVTETYQFPLFFLIKSSIVDPKHSIAWTSFKVDHAYRYQRAKDARVVSSVDDQQLASGFMFRNATTSDLLLPLAFTNKNTYAESDEAGGCYTRNVLGGTAYPNPDPSFIPYQILSDKEEDSCPTASLMTP